MNRHLGTTSPSQPPKVGAPVFRPVDWQRLARANTHPLRVSILEVFGIDGGRTMSSTDLAYELQNPLANVNYHVTELAKHGLIVLSHRKKVRGATEHFYRLPGAAAKPSANGNGRTDARNGVVEQARGVEPTPASPVRAI
jgi:biotin operon repressor